mmetsp:Transcript_45126/g.134753  ORF Transcript_45126/g.134753 Transcript_45126/m.134753 type:complete len:479 (-) Transcript_45126:374-1810(-)
MYFDHLNSAIALKQYCPAAGVAAQTVVMKHISSLPIQTLLNLLGRGYGIVISGYQFGGMLAHALTAKLLLQVQDEISVANKMGIDLAALARTSEKVMSFAFSSPFFANSALMLALEDKGLGCRLHTVWRANDASPAFLAMCNDMYVEAASKVGDNAPADAMLGTVEWKRLQAFLSSILADLPQVTDRRVKEHVFITCPTLSDRTSATSLASQPDIGSLTTAYFADGRSSSPGDIRAKGCTAGTANIPIQRLARLSCSGTTVQQASSPCDIRAKGCTPATASVPVQRPARPSCSGTTTTVQASSPKLSGNSKSLHTHEKGSTSCPATSLPLSQPACNKLAAANAAYPTLPSELTQTTHWRTHLGALLALLTAQKQSLYKLGPVGCFWLVQVAKRTTKSNGVPSVVHVHELVPLSSDRVGPTSCSYLAESNDVMLNKWESSLEELQRELMEVYCWSTFAKTLQIHGQPVKRMLRAGRIGM